MLWLLSVYMSVTSRSCIKRLNSITQTKMLRDSSGVLYFSEAKAIAEILMQSLATAALSARDVGNICDL